MASKPLTSDSETSAGNPLVLFTLCLAVLVAQVDTAIVNLAIQPIRAYFHASLSAMQWVADSYNLIYAVLLLTGGLLADIRGRRRIFMSGAGLFTIGSLVCAMAPSVNILILGRAIAGIGAALMIPASLAIIRVSWPDPAQRGRVLGIWAACNGLAMAIGPTLGGVLIHLLGWRSIFYVVIPLSILALVLAATVIAESADPQDRYFDTAAQVLSALALGGLALAAIEARDSPRVALASFAVCVLALAAFVRTENRQGDRALVPLDLFRNGVFSAAMMATAAMTFGMYGVLFLLPLAWQSGGIYSATQSGIALMPSALLFFLISPLSGHLQSKWGQRIVCTAGLALIATGLLTIGVSAMHLHGSLATEIGLALTGIGMGIATGPLTGAAVAAVSAARSGTAASLINVARMIGATLSIAVLGTVSELCGGNMQGLRAAMLTAGVIQLIVATLTWKRMQSAQ